MGGTTKIHKMINYFVLINGTNFLLASRDKVTKQGFYKWVVVKAKNPKEAELKAVESLRKSKELITLTKNKKNNPPRLFISDMKKVADKEKIKDTGFIYYNEE